MHMWLWLWEIISIHIHLVMSAGKASLLKGYMAPASAGTTHYRSFQYRILYCSSGTFNTAETHKNWHHALPQCQQRLEPCTTVGTHMKANHPLPLLPQVLGPCMHACNTVSTHKYWNHAVSPAHTKL